MIVVRVRYFSKNDPADELLDEITRAVPCSERYAEIDNECGAITYMDVRAEDVKLLRQLFPGDEVFVESDDSSHAFDSETEDARRSTHVWWRAKIEG